MTARGEEILAPLLAAIGGACAGLALRFVPGGWWVKVASATAIFAAWVAMGLWLSGLAERLRRRR